MQKLKTILWITLGAIFTFILNFFLLEDLLLISDPCYYHNHDHETSAFFDIFYSLPSWNGCHPFPSLFNFIFTLTIGGLIGFLFSRFLKKKAELKT